METEPKRKRRWFQFSLRTLLIGVTLLAMPCAYVGLQAKIVRERKDMRDWVAQHGGKVYPLRDYREDDEMALVRRWLGDEPVGAIIFDAPIEDQERRSVATLFPETTIHEKGGLTIFPMDR